MRRNHEIHPGYGRLMLRRRRRAATRLTWLLALPLGVASAVGAWHLVDATAGTVLRACYAAVMFGLVAGSICLARGGPR